MSSRSDFRARIGAVNMPEAVDVVGADAWEPTDTPNPLGSAAPAGPLGPVGPVGPIAPPDPIGPPDPIPPLGPPIEWWRWKVCNTRLREGCYRLTYRPTGTPWWGNYFAGTVRIEHVGGGYRISGDLYRRGPLLSIPWRVSNREVLRELDADASGSTADAGDGGTIPIYPRRSYHSYLKGTSARTFAIVQRHETCPVTLHFEQFDYSHPSSGFAGTFPASASRTIRYELTANGPDAYRGSAFDGATELGSVSLSWVSSSFRRARVEMRRLTGAEHPPEVGTENLRTVFQSAGWDVTIDRIAAAISKPSSLSGQAADECWSTSNLHRLLESVPGYDPTVLDTEWKTYLLAVPAELGCSRGVMFDSSGDRNNIKREGSATFSHDGFPASHSSNFGTAEDELMKDHPRAFLRSAAHEVGHSFNQIHQSFEGGNDNSIMTVTPSVADVLAGQGDTFPDDIDLAFNATVRRHLVHLPDPAVRPGAMGFFGAAVNAPEADAVAIVDELEITVDADSDSIRLGEPLTVSWTARNTSDTALPIPSRVTASSLAARISVTDPRGGITFIRPVDVEVCSTNPIETLDAGGTTSAEAVVYYGTDGFAFSEPGRHVVEVTLLWEVAGAHLCASGATDVWVAYPLTDNDNRIASLLLDPAVGEAVALGDPALAPGSEERIAAASRLQSGHPACAKLDRMGLMPKPPAKKRASRKKRAAKKGT